MDFVDPSVAVTLAAEGGGGGLVVGEPLIWNSNDKARALINEIVDKWPLIAKMTWNLQSWFNEQVRMGRPDIKVLPHRWLQSSPYRRERTAYQPGDFLIHFWGGPEDWKLSGCKRFLRDGTVLWRDEWERGER